MKRIAWVVFCALFVGATAADAAVIYMKSGREILTDTYYKENGMVYYTVAGQTVGVPESTVERVDESVTDSGPDQRLITIRMPRYVEVASPVQGVENGLYEEVVSEGACPVFRTLFGTGGLYGRDCGSAKGEWVLAKGGSASRGTETLAVLRHVPKGQGPEYGGSHWTASNGRVCEVTIKAVAPPATTGEKKLVLKFNGFPNGFFNGIYKPWAIVNGRIAYKMTKAKDEAFIELRANGGDVPSYYWAVSFGHDTYYHSVPFDTPGGLFPHEVTVWTHKGTDNTITGVVGEVSTEREHTFEFR